MMLFTPFELKGLRLRNRVLMAPMATNMGTPEGHPTPRMVEYYRARAEGGAGAIIVEATRVIPQPKDSVQRLGLWDDSQVGPLSQLAETIAGAGATPILQLVDISLRAHGRTPADMTADEIRQLIDIFVGAAVRARRAGFAAVELNSAHYTTLSDFLSYRANRRTDIYGGAEAGRSRIVAEILAGIRQTVGADFPVICRINGDEFIVAGNTLKHSIPIARLLARAGADIVHATAGNRMEDGGWESYSQLRGTPAAWLPDGANLHLAAEIRRSLRSAGAETPVIGVGKLGDPAVAEAALTSGACDLVALGRPLLSEPDWAKKVESGRPGSLRRCIYCRRCMEIFREKEPIYCAVFAES